MPRKVARKEDLRTRLAELSGWQTATRDDALVAEDLHESRAMDRIYPLSEAVFFDEFFHYIGEIGARPLFEGLDPKDREAPLYPVHSIRADDDHALRGGRREHARYEGGAADGTKH